MVPEQEAQALKDYMAAQIPKRRGSRSGCLGQIFTLIGLLIVVGLIYAAFNPWAFFMGGNFHPLGYWQGWGRMHSKTAGDYFLYIDISPVTYRHEMLPAWDVKGNGYLCTPKGEQYHLHMGGDMPRKFYVNSLGQPIRLWMSNWRELLPIGQQTRPSFRLWGHWGTGELIADDHRSLSAAFLPDGTLRPHGSHVLPSQTEDMQVTLREGTYSEFEVACRTSRQ
ncbi:MAG: hypothetical protein ACYDDI_07410 [Candidatus Acidiferrales bacterium]